MVRLGGCNRTYCGIEKTSEDWNSRNSLVDETWRAQVHSEGQAWRIFCYSCTPTYLLKDRFRLGGLRRGFSSSFSVSSSITRLGIILCLHLSFLILVLYIYCLLFIFVHNNSFDDYDSFTLVPHLDKLGQQQSGSRNFKIGVLTSSYVLAQI